MYMTNTSEEIENIFETFYLFKKFFLYYFSLKGRKIIPVLINNNVVYLLVEVRRPPIILETQNVSNMLDDISVETRLPGIGLIGHANTWLFKLSPKDLGHNYKKLFNILRRYNLSQRTFTEYNIINLIGSLQAARKNLESVQLISNDVWVKENQAEVNDFFNRR